MYWTGSVAPHAGAWIEMSVRPSRAHADSVAPHAGAWIEIRKQKEVNHMPEVAPHAGAWIEIDRLLWLILYPKSHPMRVRGLKYLL